MRERFHNASPELYFVGSIVVSVALAAIISFIPALAFGGFVRMAGVLVASDVVLYVLMKAGLLKARGRPTE